MSVGSQERAQWGDLALEWGYSKPASETTFFLKLRPIRGGSKKVAAVICLDTSLSMQNYGKIEAAKSAVLSLFNMGELFTEGDMISLLSFSDDVNTIINFKPVLELDFTDFSSVTGMRAAGNTALYQAMQKAFKLVKRVDPVSYSRLVIVVTDGDPWPRYRELKHYEKMAKDYFENRILSIIIGIGRDYTDTYMEPFRRQGGRWIHLEDEREVEKLAEFFKVEIAKARGVLERARVEIWVNGGRVEKAQLHGMTIRSVPPSNHFKQELEELTPLIPYSVFLRIKRNTNTSVQWRIDYLGRSTTNTLLIPYEIEYIPPTVVTLPLIVLDDVEKGQVDSDKLSQVAEVTTDPFTGEILSQATGLSATEARSRILSRELCKLWVELWASPATVKIEGPLGSPSLFEYTQNVNTRTALFQVPRGRYRLIIEAGGVRRVGEVEVRGDQEVVFSAPSRGMIQRQSGYCPRCGAPVEPGARYCWRCGAKLK
jgi:uncharacterized protein YegL